jgi:hypothetical protein
MDQQQLVLYFFIGVIGLIVLSFISNIFKKSSRKSIYRSFANKHNLSFTEKIKIPRAGAVGQIFSASFKEAAEKRRLSQTPGFNEETARQQAAQTRRQSLALKNVSSNSILSDPLFYNVHKTDAIFHYCEGQHQNLYIELFDELRVYTVRRSGTDSSRFKSAHTELAFKLNQTNIPSFFITPLQGSKIDNYSNRLPMKKSPGFDDRFAVVTDATQPAPIVQIDQLLTANALSAFIALFPVHLQAKGEFVRFSKRFPKLNEKDLDHLFEQCLRFVKNLNFG